MEENNLKSALNEEGTGLDENNNSDEWVASKNDSFEEVTMMNAYESRNRAKSIQADKDTDKIKEHMKETREAIELAVEEGMLSVKVDFFAHEVVLDELKRLGYGAGHMSGGKEATFIRWD